MHILFIYTSLYHRHCRIWSFGCRTHTQSHLRNRPPFSSSSRPRQNESGRSAGQQSYSQGTHRPTDHEEEIFSDDVPRKKHKKIFTQDEGEYVDFEEIKE